MKDIVLQYLMVAKYLGNLALFPHFLDDFTFLSQLFEIMGVWQNFVFEMNTTRLQSFFNYFMAHEPDV